MADEPLGFFLREKFKLLEVEQSAFFSVKAYNFIVP